MVHLSTQYIYDDPNLAISSGLGCPQPVGTAVHAWVRVLPRDARLYRSSSPTWAATGHLATPLSVILPDGTVERPDLARLGRPGRRRSWPN